MQNENQSVQSVERAFAILECLHIGKDGKSIQQLAKELLLPKSTVHRLLSSLMQIGYVAQNETLGKYRATTKMFEIGSRLVNNIDIVADTAPFLDKLAFEIEETVHLVIQDYCDVVYVYKAEAGGMRMSSRLGQRIPIYCSGVGKAILARLPYAQVQQIWQGSEIRKLTQNTITDFSLFEKEMQKVKKQGWALDDEENELGIRCVAVALPKRGNIHAAFSISGMAAQMNDETVEKYAQKCLHVAKLIDDNTSWV